MTDGVSSRRVLIITGAGASVNLGADGRSLPLMAGWATELVGALGIRAEQMGITPDMPGDAFEAKLGRFLAFEQALPIVGEFGYVGTPGPAQMGTNSDFQAWHNTATAAVRETRQALWQNLFQTFGRDRIDDTATTRAYNRLHNLIRDVDGGSPQCHLAHATTNYDTAIETAIEQDTRLELVDGFTRRSGGGSEKYTPENIASAVQESATKVPVLHIHGAVGWYYREDNDDVNRSPADQAFDDRRRPALLLPDDTKSPSTFNVAASRTWAQFEQLLEISTHVLFLGHSLHDHHIVQAVRQRDAPTAAVIYTKPDESGCYEAPNPDEVDRCRTYLPNLVAIPGEFGQGQSWADLETDLLTAWLLQQTPSDSARKRPSRAQCRRRSVGTRQGRTGADGERCRSYGVRRRLRRSCRSVATLRQSDEGFGRCRIRGRGCGGADRQVVGGADETL